MERIVVFQYFEVSIIHWLFGSDDFVEICGHQLINNINVFEFSWI